METDGLTRASLEELATGEANIKGSLLVGAVKLLRARRAEATELLKPELQHYLSERILVSSWYPEADGMELFRAFVQLVGGGDEIWRRMGHVTAADHAHSTYHHLIEEQDIDRLLQRGHVLFRAMNDQGTLRTRRLAERTFELELEAFPVLCTEWIKLLTAYFDGLVLAAGGETLRCDLLEVDYSGKRAKWLLEYAVKE